QRQRKNIERVVEQEKREGIPGRRPAGCEAVGEALVAAVINLEQVDQLAERLGEERRRPCADQAQPLGCHQLLAPRLSDLFHWSIQRREKAWILATVEAGAVHQHLPGRRALILQQWESLIRLTITIQERQ